MKTNNKASLSREQRPEAESGFWLIGLALVIAVLGVGLAGYVQMRGAEVLHENAEVTSDRMARTVKALEDYQAKNGVLPCPARRDVGPEDAAFGVPTDCNVTTVPVGSCSGGICIKKSSRPEGMRVRVGALPVRVLNLPIEIAQDSWGGTLTYAVTEPLAQSASAAAVGGGISLIDQSGTSVVTPANTARYVLLSSGPDGKGSVTDCVGEGYDLTNCISPTASSVTPEATFRLATYTSQGGTAHFDDRVLYGGSQTFKCTGATVTWTDSGNTCSGVLADAQYNETVTATNTLAGLSGTATYKCNVGNFTYVSGTCTPNCVAPMRADINGVCRMPLNLTTGLMNLGYRTYLDYINGAVAVNSNPVAGNGDHDWVLQGKNVSNEAVTISIRGYDHWYKARIIVNGVQVSYAGNGGTATATIPIGATWQAASWGPAESGYPPTVTIVSSPGPGVATLDQLGIGTVAKDRDVTLWGWNKVLTGTYPVQSCSGSGDNMYCWTDNVTGPIPFPDVNSLAVTTIANTGPRTITNPPAGYPMGQFGFVGAPAGCSPSPFSSNPCKGWVAYENPIIIQKAITPFNIQTINLGYAGYHLKAFILSSGPFGAAQYGTDYATGTATVKDYYLDGTTGTYNMPAVETYEGLADSGGGGGGG